MLRLLCISDVHGNVSAVRKLVRARKNDPFDAVVISGDLPATVPFSLITQYILQEWNLSRTGYSRAVYEGRLRPKFVYHQLRSVDLVLPELVKLDVPILFIPGNVDTREVVAHVRRNYNGVVDVLSPTQPLILDNQVAFFGLGGSLDHLGVICDHEYGLEDFNRLVDRLDHAIAQLRPTLPLVLVFHEPPLFQLNPHDVARKAAKAVRRGYHYDFPSEAGSHALELLVRKYQPLLVLNGHFHEYSGRRVVGSSPVVNPGSLSTYQYATATISPQSSHVQTRFYQILPSRLSFVNFLYQVRSFHSGSVQTHR